MQTKTHGMTQGPGGRNAYGNKTDKVKTQKQLKETRHGGRERERETRRGRETRWDGENTILQ